MQGSYDPWLVILWFSITWFAVLVAIVAVCSHHYQRRALSRIRAAEAEAARSSEIRVHAEALADELTRDLRASEQRFRALIDGSPTAMVIVEESGRIALINSEAERLLGYSRDELIGQPIDTLVPERPSESPSFTTLASIPQAESTACELQCRCHDGHCIPVELGLNPITIHDHRVVVATITDLTERKRAEAQIRRLAYFDSLTGLPNRARCQQRLGELISAASEQGFGLMFGDLDGFKEINDSLGHGAGDRVLIQIAQRLREAVGEEGEVFRFGGDEFIVLLPEGNAERDQAIAEELIRRASLPLRVAGEQLTVTVSIGSVRYPTHGDTHNLLLRRADNALYHAKSAGKNLHQHFQESMEESVTRRFLLLNELRHAVERGQLRLLYQPIVRLPSLQIIGAEALVYWQHPEQGLITPITFIPVAEESGLIESLGEWVLDEAIQQAARWRAPEFTPFRIAVNVAGAQFRNWERLRDIVCATLRQHDYPAGGLELEITERHIMHDPCASIATLQTLSELGVVISLDDFGTGYSSLSYLRQFPVDKLKVDRSFANQIDREGASLAIFRTVVELGHSLGMAVTTEGIEREAQVAALLSCGCDEAQGYLFGRPMPAADLERLLHESLAA